MNKLKTLANQYLWLIVLAGVLAVGVSVFWGYGKYLEHKENAQVESQKAAANSAVNSAVNSENQAANSSTTRTIEDGIREKTIAPRLEVTRRNSEVSRSSLTKARQRYNEKAIPSNPSRADDCAQLARLFPDTKFEYCK